jgi:hypothetical protein
LLDFIFTVVIADARNHEPEIKIKLSVAWHMSEELSATQEVIWCVHLDNFVYKFFSHLEMFIIEYREDVSSYQTILNRKHPIENYEQDTWNYGRTYDVKQS